MTVSKTEPEVSAPTNGQLHSPTESALATTAEEEMALPPHLEPSDLIKALDHELDAVRLLVDAVTLIAIILIFAFLTRQDPIEMGFIKVAAKNVFIVAAPALAIGNIAIVVHLAKLHAILRAIPLPHWKQAYSSLSTHKWVLNPFAQYSFSGNGRGFGTIGYATLMVCWWLCFASLIIVSIRQAVTVSVFWLIPGLLAGALFFRAGLYTTAYIDASLREVIEKTTHTDWGKNLKAHLEEVRMDRRRAKFRGGIVSAILVLILAAYMLVPEIVAALQPAKKGAPAQARETSTHSTKTD